MALGMSATMMAFLLSSFVVVSHCGVGALLADSATNSSSSYKFIIPAKVQAVEEAEGRLRLPSSVAQPDPNRLPVEPVAEPDPDRLPIEPITDQSHPDIDELATNNEPCSEGQQEQIDDKDKDEAEEREKANRKREGKKKTKKRHDGDDKGKKDKTKKHHRQSDDDEDDNKEKENTKKGIHRHHHAEDESVKPTDKLSHHTKNSDDKEEQEEKKAKRWRKSIKSRFGHGRRSQREEAEKAKVNN